MIDFIFTVDQAVEQFFYLHRTPFFVTFFKFVTQFGDGVAITIVGISIAVALINRSRAHDAVGLAVSIFCSLATSFFLKLIIERARPLSPFPIIDVAGYAFPSLHATMAMAMYGFLVYLVWKSPQPALMRWVWMIIPAALVVLVGFSRIYLGVHFLSDVIAGYIVGSLFVWIGIQAAQYSATRSTRFK